jgi:hypothetical protein
VISSRFVFIINLLLCLNLLEKTEFTKLYGPDQMRALYSPGSDFGSTRLATDAPWAVLMQAGGLSDLPSPKPKCQH